MTKKKSPPPTLMSDPYRTYDTTVLEFFSDLTVVGDGGKLQAVVSNFATPKREFATQAAINPNLIEPVTGLSPKTDARAAKTVAEPALSVRRLSPMFDNSRFTPLLIRKLQIMDRNRAWLQSRFPLPYDIHYQIDIRAKYRTHLNQIMTQIQLKFLDYYVPVTVEWGGPFGSKSIYLSIEQVLDNSILEADETGEALLRSTVTVLLKGWFLQKLTTTPTALHLYRDVFIVEDTYDLADGAPDRAADLSMELEAQ